MLHRFRVAMVRPGRDRLSGYVEVDDTYVGGDESGVRGRETDQKAIVAIAVEVEEPRGFGRARLQRVLDVSKDSLIPFVTSAVEPGATVHTDGWQAYWTVPDHGYKHERTVMRQQSDPAHVVMPGVHRVASLLKRWLLGTHQGSVSPQHLDAYLNEFTFRFNTRNLTPPRPPLSPANRASRQLPTGALQDRHQAHTLPTHEGLVARATALQRNGYPLRRKAIIRSATSRCSAAGATRPRRRPPRPACLARSALLPANARAAAPPRTRARRSSRGRVPGRTRTSCLALMAGPTARRTWCRSRAARMDGAWQLLFRWIATIS